MAEDYEGFYEKASKQHKEYAYRGKGKLVFGKKPDFFSYLRKHSGRSLKALDFGCGSGELAIRLSPYFSEIAGVDASPTYVETANQKARDSNAGNVSFLVSDGRKLPFNEGYFDVVYSSRGPLSESADFMNEALRVLKREGLLIEETIGENDKIELKRIFGRGQNYPSDGKRIDYIRNVLEQCNAKLLEFEYYEYGQSYASMSDVIEVLQRSPIIPDFDPEKDRDFLKRVKEELDDNGITLSSQRLLWRAMKQG